MPKLKHYAVDARLDERFKVEVTTETRVLCVDQPVQYGGTNAGASPVEHLFASLAGCIATTARILAKQKGVCLRGISMTIDGMLDLDVISGKSMTGRPGVTGINVNLSLSSDMPPAEREAFLDELQKRCPVCDTISATTPITLVAN